MSPYLHSSQRPQGASNHIPGMVVNHALGVTLQMLLASMVLLPDACRATSDIRASGQMSGSVALHSRRSLYDAGVLPTSTMSQASQNLTEEQEEKRRQATVNWTDVSHLDATATHHTTQKAHRPVLFIGVLSSSGYKVKRDAIRATWGADHRLHRVMFFVALPKDRPSLDALQKEAAQQGDLAMEPHTHESYWNITNQTLDMFRFATVDRAFTHFMKVDDDSFVRVGPLLHLLGQLPHEHLMVGNIGWEGGRPRRDGIDSWSLSEEEWGRARWPVWADGGSGYVVSMDLVREIAAGGAIQAGSLRFEDVTVGVWVEQAALLRGWMVTYAHHKGFNIYNCEQGDITSHRIIPQRMVCIYEHSGQDCCYDMIDSL